MNRITMSKIERIDELLLSLKKPNLNEIKRLTLNENDYLIICAGFEDRASAALSLALQEGAKFNLIVINYLPHVDENTIDSFLLSKINSNLNVQLITYDRQNPTRFGVALSELIKNKTGDVYLDVAAMSRLLIVQSIEGVAMLCGLSNFKIIYSAAKEYPPSREEARAAIDKCEADPLYNALFLSAGVFDITIVPELSSSTINNTQSRLVCFPTFSPDQLAALKNELSPSRYTYIHGAPPYEENKWRPEAISKINKLTFKLNSEQVTTSTLNYEETLDFLLELYGKRSMFETMLISPTGSKMQTVAVALFHLFMSDTQIVYPTPITFCTPSKYTSGIGATYQLDLSPFHFLYISCKVNS